MSLMPLGPCLKRIGVGMGSTGRYGKHRAGFLQHCCAGSLTPAELWMAAEGARVSHHCWQAGTASPAVLSGAGSSAYWGSRRG